MRRGGSDGRGLEGRLEAGRRRYGPCRRLEGNNEGARRRRAAAGRGERRASDERDSVSTPHHPRSPSGLVPCSRARAGSHSTHPCRPPPRSTLPPVRSLSSLLSSPPLPLPLLVRNPHLPLLSTCTDPWTHPDRLGTTRPQPGPHPLGSSTRSRPRTLGLALLLVAAHGRTLRGLPGRRFRLDARRRDLVRQLGRVRQPRRDRVWRRRRAEQLRGDALAQRLRGRRRLRPRPVRRCCPPRVRDRVGLCQVPRVAGASVLVVVVPPCPTRD